MKIVAQSGKRVLKINRSEWLEIGTSNGWIQEAKKKKKKKKKSKDWDPNPWAVCTQSVGDKAGTRERSEWGEGTKEKYERCVKKVKKEQS